MLWYAKSRKVKLWVKRMSTSTCKMGLGGTLRKELVLKCLFKSIAWCWGMQKVVELCVKRIRTSTYKISLRGILRKELVLK